MLLSILLSRSAGPRAVTLILNAIAPRDRWTVIVRKSLFYAVCGDTTKSKITSGMPGIGSMNEVDHRQTDFPLRISIADIEVRLQT